MRQEPRLRVGAGPQPQQGREKILGSLVASRRGGIGMVVLAGCQYTSASITGDYWTAFQDCGKHQLRIN